MPKDKERIGPSPSLIQRLFGGPINTVKDWPQLQQSLAGRQIEMPNEAAKLNMISEMGPLSRMRHPDAYAVTGPFGNIALNRKLIETDKQNLDDVMVHELTHVGQGKKGFLGKFINPSKIENDAIDREATRNVRRGDIYLPSVKKRK